MFEYDKSKEMESNSSSIYKAFKFNEDSDLASVMSDSYDLVLNGVEIGGGSSKLINMMTKLKF